MLWTSTAEGEVIGLSCSILSKCGINPEKGYTTMHDYQRHGTTTMFVALNPLDGTVMATCMPLHRHQEWLRFLCLIDRHTSPDKQLHLIVDNIRPSSPRAERHPRFHFPFTSTAGNWLNMVERFFRDLIEPAQARSFLQRRRPRNRDPQLHRRA